ncbi:hypothetical protein [Pseudomonas triclosanedens]|uniref:DUF5983 family protein n=1 Tax=Pseudomonas triclosanedens TaxID=2961893 RepID=UPI0020C1D001|nr:hypothetical protein [Pseudomonas triclosanedens]ELR2939950.1 hypothetical protein [Pseudomonas aeruginosa]MCP8473809.1 hypothetical protein [Pseudomonas triclosanedens]
MQSIHFSLIFTGTVSPNGGDEQANHLALTEGELRHNLAAAIDGVTGNGGVTQDSPATLEEHACEVFVAKAPLDIMSVPTLSIAHLDAATAEYLSEVGSECGFATVANYGEGMFIRFLEEEGLTVLVPECARSIRAWLKSQGFGSWVRLDRDWERVPELQAYDW